MTDPIVDADLHAFVDGQLDRARRMEVEGYLAGHPEVAARVMADLRARDALVLSFGGNLPQRPRERVLEAARRLERGLVWRRIGLRLRRAAAVAILVGAGWLAHAQVGLFEITESEASPKPPAFVEDARHSHATALIRARMASQREMLRYDPAEIESETGVVLPTLPREWRVVDAQVFPSRLGHSVELVLETQAVGRASIFAARAPAFDVIAPTLARAQNAITVYWQSGELVYALTAAAPEAALEKAAARLHATLR
ncbi:MAG TPA: anti-sigma factor [Beijerinckiaceae bacterium]|nr:anti-sigma factor [Beijerinckiaceae bacterium]